MGGRGEGADPVSVGYKQLWVYWGGGIIRSMDWTYVEITFTGNCEVEAGSKPSKGGCGCASSVMVLVLERLLNGFMGVWAGAGSASRSPKRTAIALNK